MKNLRSHSAIPLLLGALAAIRPGSRPAGVAKIPSHKIERKEVVEQLSKQKIAKMKGKKNRKNRGRNRKPKYQQDTALYTMLRR